MGGEAWRGRESGGVAGRPRRPLSQGGRAGAGGLVARAWSRLSPPCCARGWRTRGPCGSSLPTAVARVDQPAWLHLGRAGPGRAEPSRARKVDQPAGRPGSTLAKEVAGRPAGRTLLGFLIGGLFGRFES